MDPQRHSPQGPADEPPEPRSTVILRIVRGRLLGPGGQKIATDIPVRRARFLVGRDDSCDLTCRSPAVSRRHCLVERRGDRVTVRDLGSRNGTFLNGMRIQGECRVQSGDCLRVGRLEFHFQISARPQRAAEPGADQFADSVVDLLQDSDDIERQWRNLDPSSRYLRLDGPDAEPAEQAEDAAGRDTQVANSAETKIQRPGKLPPIPGIQGADSKEAAGRAIQKIFDDTRKLRPGYR
ncbi:MAG: FHA domain-containing protein [Pirellulaceae bacterium]|nr:FHA domain-containing protein [Pirellulaceae bacterium]